MKRFAMITGLLLAVVLILSACSGNASASNAGAGNGGVTLNVTMSEFKYDPASWTIPAGKPVTVILNNSGSDSHTWTVLSKPIQGSYTLADRGDVLFNSGRVSPGSSKTVSFTAPATPGNYPVICILPGHFEAGMLGQLTVK
jgi:uncharacterized cupredoxin-like copper-binding protein